MSDDLCLQNCSCKHPSIHSPILSACSRQRTLILSFLQPVAMMATYTFPCGINQMTEDLEIDVKNILITVDDKTFNEDDWNVVIRECGSLASKWRNTSGLLGLRISDIDNIEYLRANGNDCWNEALIHWIRQNYSTEKYGLPSWRTLLRAVAMVDKHLFKELASKHEVSSLSTIQTIPLHFKNVAECLSYMRNVTWDQAQDLPLNILQLFLKSDVEEIQKKYQFALERNFIDEDKQHEVELQLNYINGLLSDIIQSLLRSKKAAIDDDKLKEIDRKLTPVKHTIKNNIDGSMQSILEVDYPALPQPVSDVEASPSGEFLVVQWKDSKNDASDLQCYHIYVNDKLKQ